MALKSYVKVRYIDLKQMVFVKDQKTGKMCLFIEYSACSVYTVQCRFVCI